MFSGSVRVRFHRTKQMSGERKNGQLGLIKVNEDKCVIKGKLAGHFMAYRVIGGEVRSAVLPYLSLLNCN
jgi:hypothetical protein